MKNRINKFLKSVVVSLVLVIPFLTCKANAIGRTNIAISNTSPKDGEEVTVTITGTQGGDKIRVSYSEPLSFKSCSAPNTVNNGLITFTGNRTTITFICKGSGTADILAAGAQNEKSSVKLKVLPSSATSNDSNRKNKEKSKTKQNKDNDIDKTDGSANKKLSNGVFYIDGKNYVISENIKDNIAPKGFSIKSENIDGLNKKALSNGNVTLLLLKEKNTKDDQGKLFIYDKDSGEVKEMKLLGTLDNYLMVMIPSDIPSPYLNFENKEYNNKSYPVYIYKDKGKKRIFAYGITSKDKDACWYELKGKNGEFKKINEKILQALGKDKVLNHKKKDGEFSLKKIKNFILNIPNNPKHFLIFLSVIFVVLLLIFVNTIRLMLKNRKKDKDDKIFDNKSSDEAIDLLSKSLEKKKSEREVNKSNSLDKKRNHSLLKEHSLLREEKEDDDIDGISESLIREVSSNGDNKSSKISREHRSNVVNSTNLEELEIRRQFNMLGLKRGHEDLEFNNLKNEKQKDYNVNTPEYGEPGDLSETKTIKKDDVMPENIQADKGPMSGSIIVDDGPMSGSIKADKGPMSGSTQVDEGPISEIKLQKEEIQAENDKSEAKEIQNDIKPKNEEAFREEIKPKREEAFRKEIKPKNEEAFRKEIKPKKEEAFREEIKLKEEPKEGEYKKEDESEEVRLEKTLQKVVQTEEKANESRALKGKIGRREEIIKEDNKRKDKHTRDNKNIDFMDLNDL